MSYRWKTSGALLVTSGGLGSWEVVPTTTAPISTDQETVKKKTAKKGTKPQTFRENVTGIGVHS